MAVYDRQNLLGKKVGEVMDWLSQTFHSRALTTLSLTFIFPFLSLSLSLSLSLLPPSPSLQVRLGLQQLATRLLNPSAVIQAAIPAIFKKVPQSFFDQTMEVFENNAKTCYSILSSLPGLKPVMPAGSMFIMVSQHCQKILHSWKYWLSLNLAVSPRMDVVGFLSCDCQINL